VGGNANQRRTAKIQIGTPDMRNDPKFERFKRTAMRVIVRYKNAYRELGKR